MSTKITTIDDSTDRVYLRNTVADLGTTEQVTHRIYCGIFDEDSEPLNEIAHATSAIRRWPADSFTFRLHNNRRFVVTVAEIEEAD